MLRRWLGPLGVEEFEHSYLGQRAWAAAGVAADECSACDWTVLDEVLASPDLDALVVARGRHLDLPCPRSVHDVRMRFESGIGLVVRHAERHDARVRELATRLASDLAGRAHAQIFVTPGASHGFSWHYDAEDVFIVQTAGIKDYYFRANTVFEGDPRAPSYDFSGFHDETSPVQTARLLAGDVLYVPARWWHMARCVEESLSISLGVVTE